MVFLNRFLMRFGSKTGFCFKQGGTRRNRLLYKFASLLSNQTLACGAVFDGKYAGLLHVSSVSYLMPPDFLVSTRKQPFCPIFVLEKIFNPRNILYMSVVKNFIRLELEQKFSFLDGHHLNF